MKRTSSRNGWPGAEPINEDARAFPESFFRQALEQASDKSGWDHLGTFGSYVNKLRPGFDSRNCGCKKLSDLVKARSDAFETEERAAAGSGPKVVYVRAKCSPARWPSRRLFAATGYGAMTATSAA